MAMPGSDVAAPLLVEEIAPGPDPVACCEQLDGLPFRLFLDSAARTGRLGRYSFLTADPVLIVRSRGRRTEIIDAIAATHTTADEDALATMRRLVTPYGQVPVDGLPPFQGGVGGCIGYD